MALQQRALHRKMTACVTGACDQEPRPGFHQTLADRQPDGLNRHGTTNEPLLCLML